MRQINRREFLGLSGTTALGMAIIRPELRLRQPIDVDNPLETYPDRDWERIYRNQYAYDGSFTFVCSPNDTHACRMRAFTRNGVILRSESNYDVERYADLYGNTATAHWHPRGCKKGQSFHRRVYGPHRLKGPLMRQGWKAWADEGFPELDAASTNSFEGVSYGRSLQLATWTQDDLRLPRGAPAKAVRRRVQHQPLYRLPDLRWRNMRKEQVRHDVEGGQNLCVYPDCTQFH